MVVEELGEEEALQLVLGAIDLGIAHRAYCLLSRALLADNWEDGVEMKREEIVCKEDGNWVGEILDKIPRDSQNTENVLQIWNNQDTWTYFIQHNSISSAQIKEIFSNLTFSTKLAYKLGTIHSQQLDHTKTESFTLYLKTLSTGFLTLPALIPPFIDWKIFMNEGIDIPTDELVNRAKERGVTHLLLSGDRTPDIHSMPLISTLKTPSNTPSKIAKNSKNRNFLTFSSIISFLNWRDINTWMDIINRLDDICGDGTVEGVYVQWDEIVPVLSERDIEESYRKEEKCGGKKRVFGRRGKQEGGSEEKSNRECIFVHSEEDRICGRIVKDCDAERIERVNLTSSPTPLLNLLISLYPQLNFYVELPEPLPTDKIDYPSHLLTLSTQIISTSVNPVINYANIVKRIGGYAEIMNLLEKLAPKTILASSTPTSQDLSPPSSHYLPYWLIYLLAWTQGRLVLDSEGERIVGRREGWREVGNGVEGGVCVVGQSVELQESLRKMKRTLTEHRFIGNSSQPLIWRLNLGNRSQDAQNKFFAMAFGYQEEALVVSFRGACGRKNGDNRVDVAPIRSKVLENMKERPKFVGVEVILTSNDECGEKELRRVLNEQIRDFDEFFYNEFELPDEMPAIHMFKIKLLTSEQTTEDHNQLQYKATLSSISWLKEALHRDRKIQKVFLLKTLLSSENLPLATLPYIKDLLKTHAAPLLLKTLELAHQGTLRTAFYSKLTELFADLPISPLTLPNLVFLTPEYRGVIMAGGIGTMLADLCECLASLPVPITVIMPYYLYNAKKETDYLTECKPLGKLFVKIGERDFEFSLQEKILKNVRIVLLCNEIIFDSLYPEKVNF